MQNMQKGIELKTQKRKRKRECHSCPLNGKGDDYCWKVCMGPPEASRQGVSSVSLDSMPAADEYLAQTATDLADADSHTQFADSVARHGAVPKPQTSTRGTVDGMTYDTERALVVILASLMSLTDIQLCIFRHAYHGQTLETIGDFLPVPMSKQAVSKHIHTICSSHPAIAAMLERERDGDGERKHTAKERRTGRGRRGRRECEQPCRSSVRQLDMFCGVTVCGTYKRRNRDGSTESGGGAKEYAGKSADMCKPRDARTRDGVHYTPTLLDLSI